jgi:molybdate transport system substrate-binding protein
MVFGVKSMRRIRQTLSIFSALFVAVLGGAKADDAPLVAAASDLQFALSEISTSFAAETGQSVRLTFGSSGNFARQFRSGAPIELFLSADERLVTALAQDGFTEGEGALYAEGRLALIVPVGSPLKADGSLADLAVAIADGRLHKLAIANPEHAPYGERAKEVLIAKGLWDQIQAKLVFGENVSQAAQFAVSGAAQGGIIAQSLAVSPAIARLGASALIPAEWHSPLRQRMVLSRNAGGIARRFFDYIRGDAARAVLQRNGFGLPP